MQAKASAIQPNTPDDQLIAQVVDLLLELKAAAPPDLKADMDLVVDYTVNELRTRRTIEFDQPANIKAARAAGLMS